MSQLERMLVAQRQLQVDSFGIDPLKLTGDERAEFIRWNALALTDEIHEMLGEVGWKPWATARHVNHDLAVKELVDAWHFFMNLLLTVSGVKPSWDDDDDDGTSMLRLANDFEELYFAKRRVNADRQADGYTGTDKCGSCGRDRATTARAVVVHEQEVVGDAVRNYEVPVTYCPCGSVYR